MPKYSKIGSGRKGGVLKTKNSHIVIHSNTIYIIIIILIYNNSSVKGVRGVRGVICAGSVRGVRGVLSSG